MGVVPVRPQAIEAAAKAHFESDDAQWGNATWDGLDEESREEYRAGTRAAVQVFLAAEGITAGNWEGLHASDDSYRLCGPWRRVDG
jgi:hypothetical protein